MMNKIEVFDGIELLVDLPELNLNLGGRGEIVYAHPEGTYEVKFSDRQGETIGLCTLSSDQFALVWREETEHSLSLKEELTATLDRLSEEHQQQVLEFARSLCQE